uniref:Uncharacterized protein n=1 Tax=Zea mays TaxID=4577 RepID=B4FUE8_MAIZE|nr:unknown [Zea mays]
MQQMLKSVVQHFSYRHEVRIEAETLHNLFFNIMKIAFPDSDFMEAKNAMSFSNPGSGAHSDHQAGASSSAPGIGDIQWAKPAKRLRTCSPGPPPRRQRTAGSADQPPPPPPGNGRGR